MLIRVVPQSTLEAKSGYCSVFQPLNHMQARWCFVGWRAPSEVNAARYSAITLNNHTQKLVSDNSFSPIHHATLQGDADTPSNNSTTTTSPPRKCKHLRLRGGIRGDRADCDNRNTTNNNNNQQEVDRQTARTKKIMEHWRVNYHSTIRRVQEEATCAANAGFQLAEQLYRDIVDGTSSVRSIAFDQLKELVRFCFSYAFEIGQMTWPSCRNSIHARNLPPAHTPGQEDNWMVERSLWLVYDLHNHLQLDMNVRSALRRGLVDGLHFVSGLCHEKEIAASDHVNGSLSTLPWWQDAGDEVLEFMVDTYGHGTADRILRDAADDAEMDQDLRKAWRIHLRDRRWQDAVDNVLD